MDPLAFTVGGLAPDIGLTVMTAGASLVLPRTRGMTRKEVFEYVFGTLFFESKPWIAASNVLHSPVVVTALSLAGRRSKLGSFAAGCALHIAMDVPVHHDDGPVLGWPLNWSYRFRSPVSYWDRQHHAAIVAPLDLAITIVGGALLVRDVLRTR